MTSWSGCATSASGLDQTDDQVNQFAGVMDSIPGTVRKGLWGNGNVWASDIVDDAWGGADGFEADTADIYVLSSHGVSFTDGNGQQEFESPYCQPGGTLSSPFFDANYAMWGGGLSSPANLRWAMLLACQSVDVHPDQQWTEAFNAPSQLGWTRFEYIMGYRGNSADSFTTDEVAGDFANSALNNGTKFKAAWFSSTSDWFVDDTAEVMSGGQNAAQAINNRDNLNQWSTRRLRNTPWPVFYWSWQQG